MSHFIAWKCLALKLRPLSPEILSVEGNTDIHYFIFRILSQLTIRTPLITIQPKTDISSQPAIW